MPTFRHPNQKTCGAKCSKWYASKAPRQKEAKRTKYHSDDKHRERLVDAVWTRKLKDKYGITPRQYAVLLETQGGGCAVCSVRENQFSQYGRRRRLEVDHDHITGHVRGILCHLCNMAVGYIKNCPERASLIAAYLRKHYGS